MRNEQSRQCSTEAVIDGKVIPFTGGDSVCFRQITAYIDNKIAELGQDCAYARQNSKWRVQILQPNLADNCLQTRAENTELKEEVAAHTSKVYTLKRESVEQRLRMETLQEDAKDEVAEASLAAEKQRLEKQFAATEKEKELLQAEKERLTASTYRFEGELEMEEKRSKELETEPDELLSK